MHVKILKLSVFDSSFFYWPLLSGCDSSTPTLPSAAKSVFTETGTNSEVSGDFGGQLLEETVLLQSKEAASLCLCSKPGEAWKNPQAGMRVDRRLKWRSRRENTVKQLLTDMAKLQMLVPTECYIQKCFTVAPLSLVGIKTNITTTWTEQGHTLICLPV